MATPAYAYSYSGTGAVGYAHQYACNGTDCHNSQYLYLGSDCANFVSQAIHDGGGLTYIKPGTSSTAWFYQVVYYFGFPDFIGSQSWVSASSLYAQLVASNRLSSIANPTMSLKYSGANGGDIYLYDWGHGEGFSHVSLATDNGNFANYFDPGFQVNYTSITGGSGSRMVQHTTDRDWAPWNFGYWNENDPSVRALMKTKILRIAPAG